MNTGVEDLHKIHKSHNEWLEKLKNIQVRFVTKLSAPEFQLDNANQVLSVPVELKRYGLSELLNHLLNISDLQPFDFLVNNRFLRTSIKQYLLTNSSVISPEDVLEVEYTLVIPPPKSKSEVLHPDWVSSVDTSVALSFGILSGCYDGIIRLISAKPEQLDVIASFSGHSAPVKDVRVHGISSKGNVQFVSCSQDSTVRVWEYDPKENSSVCLAIGNGHTDTVSCIDVIPETGSSSLKFASGGWDAKLHLWSIVPSDEYYKAVQSEEISEEPVKKQKGNQGQSVSNNFASPIAELSGCNSRISGICWPHALAIYTCSWDNSIRHWDAQRGISVRSWNSQSESLCIKYSNDSSVNLLASGHVDRAVRLWDPRESSQALHLKLRSHKNWVNSISWIDANMLVSGSRDGTCKIWDIRSNIPLSTIHVDTDDTTEIEGTSIFAVGSVSPDMIVYGGTNCKLTCGMFSSNE